MKKTLYDILAIQPSASADAIEEAYRTKLDYQQNLKQSGDPEADNNIVKLRGAYDVLSNHKRRAEYDKRLSSLSSTDYPHSQRSSSGVKKGPGMIKIGLGLVVVVGIANGLLRTETKSNDTEAVIHNVEYAVTGIATTEASLTYSNNQGGTEQQTVTLPWSKTMPMIKGQHFYLSAQNSESTGTIYAQISVDGKLVKLSESSGAYTIATAHGNCC